MLDEIISTTIKYKARKRFIWYYKYQFVISFEGCIFFIFDKQNTRFFANTVVLRLTNYNKYKSTKVFNRFLHFFYKNIILNQHRNIYIEYNVISRVNEMKNKHYKPMLLDEDTSSKNDSINNEKIENYKYLDIKKKDKKKEVKKKKDDKTLSSFFFFNEQFGNLNFLNLGRKIYSSLQHTPIFSDDFYYYTALLEKQT